jgi:hypothetical protein
MPGLTDLRHRGVAGVSAVPGLTDLRHRGWLA